MLNAHHTGRPVSYHGFTLTELVIVMAVMAILLAIAYPSYLSQAIKSRRADGHNLLYEAAQRQQQFFTENNAFTATVGNGGLEMVTASQEGYYTLSITQPGGATSYTLTGTTVAPQTADTNCGNLTLTHLNVKGCSATGCDVDRCW